MEHQVHAIEGSIFDNDTIFLFRNSYSELKRCVENKKNEGHNRLRIDMFDYQDESYSSAIEMINRVGSETGVMLEIV